MSMTEALIAELTRESETTRRVLERVPEDRLSWKPHEKSMSLGQLALHIARLPAAITGLFSEPTGSIRNVPLPEASSRDEILAELDEGIATARSRLTEWGEEGLNAEWRLVRDGETLLAMPRSAGLRSILLNHSYHHRGQLTVYLRLLDVPLPPVYGSTADERLFE